MGTSKVKYILALILGAAIPAMAGEAEEAAAVADFVRNGEYLFSETAPESSVSRSSYEIITGQNTQPPDNLAPKSPNAGAAYAVSQLKAYTDKYRAVFSGINDSPDSQLVEKLAPYKVLLVGGFMTDINTDYSVNGRKKPSFAPMGLYFSEQAGWLKAQNISVGVVELNSQSGIVKNAADIRNAINQSDKPVILIAHSKGGLDSLEALLTLEDKAKVAGAITIQTPFFGTPLADGALANPLIKKPAVWMLEKLGGSEDSVIDLSVAVREKYMSKNAAAIKELTAKIPWIAFGSWKNPTLVKDTMFSVPRNLLLAQGLKNDGLVPPQNALLPGASWIVVEGVDHLCTTLSGNKYPELDRVAFLKTMLTLLLEKK